MPTRTRFDQFVKQMYQKALSPRGEVETDAEVSPDTQRIDVWFTPTPGRPPAQPSLGLLDRLTCNACLLEPFHRTPDAGELLACLHKHLGFRRILAKRPAPPPEPRLWVISAGRPTAGIQGLHLSPARSYPRGVYLGPPLLRLGLVVVSELPATREMLMLRLTGRGRVLKRAIAELKVLPKEAPERRIALPVLLRLRIEVPADPAKRTSDDEEFLMSTEDVVEIWERRVREEGVQQGLAKGLIGVYEARFGKMPSKLQSVILGTQDESTLQGWYALMATHSAEEIAAALRKRPRR